MQRREFLRGTLALGATAMLPNGGLTNGLEADQTTFSFDADVILVNEQHVAVALKYDETTMTAPVVLAKDNCLLTKRLLDVAAEKEIPIAFVDRRWASIGWIKTAGSTPAGQPRGLQSSQNSVNPAKVGIQIKNVYLMKEMNPIFRAPRSAGKRPRRNRTDFEIIRESDAWLDKWDYEQEIMGNIGLFAEQEMPLAQDIFNNLDIGDVIPETHYETIADILGFACYLQQRRGNVDSPPLCSSHNFCLDGDLVLVSRRGVSVTLRYTEKMMLAPVVLAKGEATQQLMDEIAKGTRHVYVNVKVPGNSPFGEMLHSLRHVRCFLIDEQEESVVQDLYDHLDVNNVIPEKHYGSIADMLERIALAIKAVADAAAIADASLLSQAEVERLLNMMSTQS